MHRMRAWPLKGVTQPTKHLRFQKKKKKKMHTNQKMPTPMKNQNEMK